MINVVVIVVALLASAWDLKTYIIPNWLTFGGIILGVIMGACSVGAPGGVGDSLLGVLAGFLFLLVPFMFGVVGGGDVKLLAVFGAIGGFQFAINTLLIGSVAGGAFALLYLLYRKRLGSVLKEIYFSLITLFTLKKVSVNKKVEPVIPYGVFISIGAVLSLFCEVVKVALW